METDQAKPGIYIHCSTQRIEKNKLIKYFSKFGTIDSANFKHNSCIIDFTDIASAQKALVRKTHFLDGQRLRVTLKRSKAGLKTMNNVLQNEEEEEEKKAIYNSIISELKSFSDFYEEFLAMRNILQPNNSESHKKLNQVCQDINKAVARHYPQVKVLPFGSRITGLDFSNSDIDIYLGNMYYADEMTHLKQIRTCLREYRGFGGCLLIPATVPIIKCIHFKTGIKCDLNIKNVLGVCNSQLVCYYLGADVSLKRAMLVLKYWAARRKLTGRCPLFSNYGLVMMFIFFVQQAPYNLPPVISLQEPSYSINDHSCVWNGNFIPNYNFDNHLLQASILDLLKQFFTFYSTFPFNTDIICPYLGLQLPKQEFQVPKEKLPDCYRLYKRQPAELKINSVICVQDPFEHCRNICSSVTRATLETFVTECLFALSICEKNDTHILYKLLTESPPDGTKALQHNIQSDFFEFTLSKFFQTPSVKQWTNLDTIQFFKMALEDFLQFKIQHEETISTPEFNGHVFSYAGQFQLWAGRAGLAKNLNKILLNAMMLREREMRITNEMIKKQVDLDGLENILELKLFLQDTPDEIHVKIEKVSSYKKSFKLFATAFTSLVTKWFHMYKKEFCTIEKTN
ncbi:hypothetical protein ABEB36_004490 [Hypothenemus hampei]|uniref:Speckle targeted PIP5K1A-regulated poly(A) polymerase n=1 Tax=Hypothenemus hampei TaxID=57062 RepID=A0ABD1F3U7_HYPHA